jgi:lysophospholipase L1-like esterase
MFSLLPCAILVGGAWIIAHIYYDYTHVYPFDPYLQRFGQPLEKQYPQARQGNVFRVLCMGGSTTANWKLPPQQRYPTVLQHLLAERYPTRTIQVLNAGQDWWTTKHDLINYVTYAHAWSPDLVIVMQGINDLGRSFSHRKFSIGEYDNQYRHHYAQAVQAAQAISFEHHVARNWLSRLDDIWFSSIRFQEVAFPVDWYRSRETFHHNLESIIHYARSDGASVVLVTQPYLYKISMSRAEENALFRTSEFIEGKGWWHTDIASTGSLAAALDAFNATTADVAGSEKAVLVDAASALPKDLQHFVDDAHYTELGARCLAEAIANGIAANGVIDHR